MTDLSQLLQKVEGAVGGELEDGKTYYIFSSKWYKAFEACAKGEEGAASPGPIDNSDVADPERPLCLRRGITEGNDYRFITEAGWRLLSQRFTCAQAFDRKAHAEGVMGTARLDLFPQLCHIYFASPKSGGAAHLREDGKPVTVSTLLPRSATLHALKAHGKGAVPASLSKAVRLPPAERRVDDDDNYFRLWFRPQPVRILSKADAPAADDADLAGGPPGNDAPGDGPSGQEEAKAADPTEPAAQEDAVMEEEGPAACMPPGETSGRPWRLLPTSTKLEELAANDLQSEFLLEAFGREGGWARGVVAIGQTGFKAIDSLDAGGEEEGGDKAPEPFDEPAWRAALAVGSRLDAQDCNGAWFEGEVVEVLDNRPGGSAGEAAPGGVLRVRFRAWEDRFAEYFSRQSSRLQPTWTRLPNFRAFKADDMVQMLVEDPAKGRTWHDCKVASVSGSSVTVEPLDSTAASGVGKEQLDVDSPALAPIGTHSLRGQNRCLRPSGGACTRTQYQQAKQAAQRQAVATKTATMGAGSTASSALTRRAGGTAGARKPQYDSDDSDDGGYGGYGYSRNRAGRPAVPGAVGLSNLGNTCFMNSMLQCLSNTEPLTRYFLSGKHKEELNTDNPLGAGGNIALAYGSLIRQLWSGKYTSVAPSKLKSAVGRKAPQFRGYAQQDSQELMSFLLDGLHEDLNRVLKKPLTETVEGGDRPDAVVAAEAWHTYQRRNRSVIVDTFGGQLRSHVKCNRCSKQSITFDPFLSVSVPLPASKPRHVVFTLLPLRDGPWVRFRVTVSSEGSFRALSDRLAELQRWDPTDEAGEQPVPKTDNIVWLKIRPRSNIVREVCPPDTPVSSIRGDDWIFAVEVPAGADPPYMAAAGEDAAEVAAAEEAAAAAGGAVSHIRAARENVVCKEDVAVLQMVQHVAGARVPTSIGYPDLLCLSTYSGAWGKVPTGKQMLQGVGDRVRRFLKPEARETFDAVESRPYKVVITNRLSGVDTCEVEPTDEPVPLDIASQVVRIVWSQDQAGALVDAEAREECVELCQESYDRAKRYTAEALTIDDCMQGFTEREQLGEGDEWYCPQCKEHRRAYKKFDIWTVPEILVLHLKRFKYTARNYGGMMGVWTSRDKLTNVVEFPETFDLSEYVMGPQPGPHLYELYGVSEHSGGLGGGHYTATVRNFEDGKWYDCNDSYVSGSSYAQSVSSRAYVLFYRRRGGPPMPVPDSPEDLPAAVRMASGADEDEDGKDEEQ